MTPEQKLESMGIVLPQAAAPVANYVPARKAGPFIFVSGQIPMVEGRLISKGKVGAGVSLEEARAAARTVAVNILAAVKGIAGDLSAVRALRVEGFVASADGFTDQPKVINGASDLIVEVLGEDGRHTRFAVGVSELPLGASVEIAAIFALKDSGGAA